MIGSFNQKKFEIMLFIIFRQKEAAETSTSSLEEDIEMLSFDSRTESRSLPSSQVVYILSKISDYNCKYIGDAPRLSRQ